MDIKIEVLKNGNTTIEVDGYKIPSDHYFVLNVASNKILFYSKDFNEAHKFKANLLYSYKYMGKKTLVLACSEQLLQTEKVDPVVFLENPSASKITGGFDWSSSVLGRNFWYDVLLEKKYNLANIAYDIAFKILRKKLVE